MSAKDLGKVFEILLENHKQSLTQDEINEIKWKNAEIAMFYDNNGEPLDSANKIFSFMKNDEVIEMLNNYFRADQYKLNILLRWISKDIEHISPEIDAIVKQHSKLSLVTLAAEDLNNGSLDNSSNVTEASMPMIPQESILNSEGQAILGQDSL